MRLSTTSAYGIVEIALPIDLAIISKIEISLSYTLFFLARQRAHALVARRVAMALQSQQQFSWVLRHSTPNCASSRCPSLLAVLLQNEVEGVYRTDI